MDTMRHWTSNGNSKFVFAISSDFIAQLEMKMERDGTTRSELAERLRRDPSRISQVLNDPGNLTLNSVVDYTRALGMKVAIIAYEDGDPTNDKGPINAQVFTECWEKLGQPNDLFEVTEHASALQARQQMVLLDANCLDFVEVMPIGQYLAATHRMLVLEGALQNPKNFGRMVEGWKAVVEGALEQNSIVTTSPYPNRELVLHHATDNFSIQSGRP